MLRPLQEDADNCISTNTADFPVSAISVAVESRYTVF